MNSTYDLDVPKVGIVKVTKKSRQKSLRIRLTSKGEVLVSVPSLTSKIAVEKFINSKIIWILKNKPEYTLFFEASMQLKSGIWLEIYEFSPKNRAKFYANRLNIYINGRINNLDTNQKKYIESKILDAMKIKAENDLLPILLDLSLKTNHEFNQAFVKNLQSRWGSCDNQKNIILNIFMLQLPSELQKYIILHELTHTKFMNHGTDFWSHLESLCPNYKLLRKQLKSYHTRIEIDS